MYLYSANAINHLLRPNTLVILSAHFLIKKEVVVF